MMVTYMDQHICPVQTMVPCWLEVLLEAMDQLAPASRITAAPFFAQIFSVTP